jgi:glutaminase
LTTNAKAVILWQARPLLILLRTDQAFFWSLTMEHPLLAYLRDLHLRFSRLQDGKVADYIPELATANPSHFGIALVTTDGTTYAVGDCTQEFTIQSISKAFVYATALQDRERSEVLRKVLVEPSGEAFNSISLDPVSGAPLNPMINAGAIATAGLVGGDDAAAQWQRIQSSLSAFAGRSLTVDERVYQSESDTGFRNRAIGWMLRNNNILGDDPMPIVENYFRQCSLLVTCRDLGIMGATLANGGINPLTRQRVVGLDQVEATLSVMSTCGMYDYAGSWLYEVGLPAKSGVGGGIVAVLPGRFAIATFSPLLDAKGNSVRGIAVCSQLSRDLGMHMMSVTHNSDLVFASEYSAAEAPSKRFRTPQTAQLLANHARRIRILGLQGELTLDGAERVARRFLNRRNADTSAASLGVLSMHRVTSISPSAARLLQETRYSVETGGGHLVFSRIQACPELEPALRRALLPSQGGFMVFEDDDLAVEWCENRLLEKLGHEEPIESAATLADFHFFDGLQAAEKQALQSMLTPMRFAADEVIIRAGDNNDMRVFLLLSGEVSVLVDAKDGHRQRLATLCHGMIFGEMALLGQTMRTATVQADSDTLCWTFTASALDELSQTYPQLKLALLDSLARLFANNLRQANVLIGALAGFPHDAQPKSRRWRDGKFYDRTAHQPH